MFVELKGISNSYGAQLIVVSKYQKNEDVLRIYHQGQRDFAENKVQELLLKKEALPSDIKWHLIGHLQSNKVKFIVPFIHCIHSVDSLKIWAEIDKQAAALDRTINILLQVKIAKEESKYGLSPDEMLEMLRSPDVNNFKNTNLIGLMGMASLTEDATQIRTEFRVLKQTFDLAKTIAPTISQLSMGMSSDYEIALEEGSTMLRIGSAVFQ
jgi:PLP dependent protein